jgi:hypothetical protein
MTQNDFDSKLAAMLIQSYSAGDARAITDETFRRDHRRVRILVVLSLFFWLLFAAGMFLLVYGLHDFILYFRISPANPGDAGFVTQEQLNFWGTDLMYRSMPYIIGAVVALPLAAICTLLVISSSRQATLKRINFSLMQISDQLNQGRGAPAPEPAAASPVAPHSYRKDKPRLARKIAFNCFLAFLLVVAALIAFAFISNPWHGYRRAAPYAAIQWDQETPRVQVNGTWYQLLSVNDLPVDKIVAYSKSMGSRTWQKHFNEDLVELLTLMGHAPGNTAALQVKDLNSQKVETLNDVPMTEANRNAILRAD